MKNFLDFVPRKNKNVDYFTKNETVTLVLNRVSIYDRLAQVIFKTPKKTRIELDRVGSIVWLCIDSKNNIYDISMILKNRLKEEKPDFNKMVLFMRALYSRGLIKF